MPPISCHGSNNAKEIEMTRELSPKAGAAMLRTAFAAKGNPITHTEALDLVAKLKGYNAWSHMQQDQSSSPVVVVASAPQEKPRFKSKFISLSEVLAQHYGRDGELSLFPRAAWQQDNPGENYWNWVENRVDIEGYSWGLTPFTFRREPLVVVTLPDGAAAFWHMEVNLTSRWGELNDYMAETKPGLPILTLDEPLLEGLRAQMYDETTFIGRKDGEFGIYYEREFCSQESEADDNDDDQEYRPHAEVVAYLLAGIAKLQAEYPTVQFCVPDASQICNDRPAVWAFVKSGSLTDEQREALGTELFKL
jgi:hypothetical protein